MELREYQNETIDMIRESLMKGFKKILVVMPTGSGKSIVQAHIAKLCLDKGNKVLALVHRRGLTEQLSDRFGSYGVSSGIIMAGVKSELNNPVQVATCQTYIRRQNFEEVNLETGGLFKPWEHKADCVITDEGHHVLSRTYQKILNAYSDKIVLGFTATPSLSSNIGMNNFYDKLIQPVTVKELIDIGSLVPGVYYGLPAPDLAGLKMVAGDYEKKGLSERVENQKIIGDIVENWNRIAFGKKTMVFAVNVKHSKAIAYEFNKNGIPAEHLDAHSSDEKRSEVIEKFRSGEITVMSNVGLYTEGTDIPEIECICLARPTKSIGLYLQMVGRGARPHPRKNNFIVLDHGKNVNEHGFYEDDIEWTLEGKKISYKKPTPKEKKDKHQMTCSICSAVFTGDTCPQCLTKIENYGKKIEAIEAELKQLNEIKEKAKDKNKCDTFRKLQPTVLVGMLLSERERLGKSDSWVRANYRNLTDRWPKSIDVRPLPATDELKSYLKYLRIKWIKSQRKAA